MGGLSFWNPAFKTRATKWPLIASLLVILSFLGVLLFFSDLRGLSAYPLQQLCPEYNDTFALHHVTKGNLVPALPIGIAMGTGEHQQSFQLESGRGPLTQAKATHLPWSDDLSSDISGEVEVQWSGEFGYELIAVLPFAYYHFLKGTLKQTTSCGTSMDAWYYFDPRHSQKPDCKRTGSDGAPQYGFPSIHLNDPPSTWITPPLASRYREFPSLLPDNLKDQPTLIVSNKYETEWGGPPVNFLPLDVLETIIELCKERGFLMVYNRPGLYVGHDDQAVLEYGDVALIDKKKAEGYNITALHEIATDAGENDYNRAQLRFFSRARCFVSVQGGTSIISSYFGGKSMIYVKNGGELAYAYNHTYPKLSSAQIVVATEGEALLKEVSRTLATPQDCLYI